MFLLFAGKIAQTLYPPTDTFQVCFTPKQKCAEGIIAYIHAAKNTIKVHAFYISSHPITNALIEAAKRDVAIEIIVDSDQVTAPYSTIAKLAKNGIKIYIDNTVKTAHNKTFLLDDTYVLTGSYNFTRAAEYNNVENIIFINDPAIAKEYLDNFNYRKSLSVAYIPKAES